MVQRKAWRSVVGELVVPLAPIAIGAATGYVALVVTTVWNRNFCLPVSAHEEKWQCDAGLVALAVTYFAAALVATLTANRHRIASELLAVVALFVANGWSPYVSFMFFGEHWYQSKLTLLFAVAPSLAGVAVAVLVPRKSRSDEQTGL
jgi:hypothetical protein